MRQMENNNNNQQQHLWSLAAGRLAETKLASLKIQGVRLTQESFRHSIRDDNGAELKFLAVGLVRIILLYVRKSLAPYVNAHSSL